MVFKLKWAYEKGKIMKILKLWIVFVIILPLQGMQQFMTTGLRSVVAAYRYQLQPYNSRFLQDFSHIKGLYKLGVRTPIMGLLATSSLEGNQDADLRALFESNQNTETAAFAKLFFYVNPVDREITITQYNKYMIRALPVSLIAHLLETKGDFDRVKEQNLIEEWHQKYTTLSDKINDPIKNKKNFEKKAKQFLKDFRSAAQKIKPHEVSSILQNVVIKMARTKVDLEQFAELFSANLPKQGYTEQDFNRIDSLFKNQIIDKSVISPEFLEEMVFWISEKKNRSPKGVYDYKMLEVEPIPLGYKNLLSDKGMPIIRPLCAEETIRIFIHALLYNAQTNCLDITLLPESIQATCLPAFKVFLERYKNFDKKNNYVSAVEWLSLVSEIPSVTYLTGDIFEISPNLSNFFKVVAYLFGITQAPTQKERNFFSTVKDFFWSTWVIQPDKLGQLLSTPERTVKFIPYNKQGSLRLIIKDKGENIVFNETAYFIGGHSHISREQDTFFSAVEETNIAMVMTTVKEKLPLKPKEQYFFDCNNVSAPELK